MGLSRYGYHPDLNPIEEAWSLAKDHVALENDGTDFAKVKDLVSEGLKKVESYWSKFVDWTSDNESKSTS